MPLVILAASTVTVATNGSPVGLTPCVDGETAIAADIWLTAVRSVYGGDVPIILTTNALEYKYWELWNAAQSPPVAAIVNTGSTINNIAIGSRDIARTIRYATTNNSAWLVDGVVVVPLDVKCSSSVAIAALTTLTHDFSCILVPSVTTTGVKSYPIAFIHPEQVSAITTVPLPSSYAEWIGSFDGVTRIQFEHALCVPSPSVSPTLCNIGRHSNIPSDAIHRTAHARVGVMGNPSDGFFGKTFAATINNFWAEAWIWPTTGPLQLLPHPLYDGQTFTNIRQLSAVCSKEGYSGGMRLMQAVCNRFFKHVMSQSTVAVDTTRNFSLTYHTNIPRQVGLAGSSALIVSLLRCLVAFYGLESQLPALGLDPPRFAAFVLSIETDDLGIAAGLQDRVAQTYEGCVFMDFSKHWFDTRGYGEYTRVSPELLPPLFLAYCPDPKDSGMATLGTLAQQFRDLIMSSDAKPWDVAHRTALLMADNFYTRLRLYGDAVVGATNMRMVTIAVELGAGAKLPGSGGAVLGVCDVLGMLATSSGTDSSTSSVTLTVESWHEHVSACMARLQTGYEDNGFVFVPITVYTPTVTEMMTSSAK